MSRDFLNICDLHNTSGTSFRCTEWKENTKYFHNSRYIDFVSLDNCLFMCIKSHISEEDNKPVPEVSVSADTRASVLTLESEYWQLILSGNNVQSFKSGIPEADDGDEVKFLAYENGEMVWKSITATATSVDSTENANVSVGTVARAASGPIQFTFQIPKGANGKDGKDGVNGTDGIDGKDGQDGEDGVDGADGITPETFLTSYVFKRAAANENVSTPKGGSFSSPYPTLDDGSRDPDWYDSIPSGSGNVYVSIGKFSSATTDPIMWSKPAKLSDTKTSQVEYLSNESVNFHGQVINTAAELERVLNAESGGLYPYRFGTYVQGVDLEEAEIRWRNEVRNAGLGIWGDDDTADSPYYMATCTSNDNGATWSAWTVVRIKGERGQNINPRGTLDALPSCNDTTYNYGDSVVLNTDGHLYIHNGNHCNSCNTNQCWVDMGYTRGDTLHVKYANDYRGDNTDAEGVFTVTINGTEHTLIWDIDGNVEVGDYIGITLNSSEAPTDPNEYKWQRWTGYDGYGYEYIYWATEKNVKPSITIPEGEDIQTDEYMPCVNKTDKRWLDDAPSVSKEQQYIWRSYRKRVDGVWSNFSEVKLHLQYANGISQTYDFYAILTVDSFEYPTSISELKYEGDLSYGFYFSGTPWLPKIKSVNTSDDNDYYVHNITIIKFDNDVYEIKGTCLYKMPRDGGEITKITPYYKLSKNTIHPYENIVEISSIPEDSINKWNETFNQYPIGLQIYNSTADAYYENGIVNDWLMYESYDDAMYNLNNYNFTRDDIVQKIAICDHYKYSFTDITESLNARAYLGVIIAIDTIYLNGEHTLPTDIWRFDKRPCTINLLEAAADMHNPSDFEKMSWVGDITLRTPDIFIDEFRKKDWQANTTDITTSIDYPYLWETDCIEIKKQSTTSTLWTPPFILSWYESPGYTTYKFKVAQTQPETPDKDETWSDTPMYVPKGMYLWCSHKLIYEDSRIDTEWSDPTVMTDSDHMQVEYSSDYDGVTTLPKLDVSGEGDFEQNWRVAADKAGCGTWSDQPAGAIYMAVCRIVGDNTSEWTVMKVTGEDAYSLKLTNSTDQWYLDNGTWFGTASTTAYVYKGANQISTTIEYRLDSGNESDSEIWTPATDGVIQINAQGVEPVVGNNSVIVRALIPNTTNNYLYQTFNVKGIQSNTGYDIVGVPSEIKHSNTWGYSPSIFYVNVHQEDINGRHVLSELPKGVYILLDIFGTNGDYQIECTPTELPWAFDISNVTQNSSGIPKAFKLYISNTENSDDPNRIIYDETYTVIVNDGKDGITKFKSTVFTRSDETPNKPEGGSFDDPNPDSDDIWKDGIVDGDAPIWSSYRWFSNETGFNDDWSEPVLMCDTPDFEVIYSSSEDITNCNPNDATVLKKDSDGGISGWLNENINVLDGKWSDDGDTNSIWMATIKKTNGEWGSWTVSKIKGEKGVGITIKGSYLSEEAFIDAIKANRFISINVGDAYIVAQKWIYVCPYGVSSISSIDQFEKLQYTGEDGYGSEQIFKLSAKKNETAPDTTGYSTKDWNTPGFVPDNWAPSPQGVTDTQPYCHVSYRKTPYTGDGYNEFSDPVLYSNYSFDGQNAAHLEITNEFDQIWTNESNVPHTGQSWMTQVIYVNESGTITMLSEDNDDEIAIVRPENVLEYQWVGDNGTEQDNSSDNTYIKFSIKQDSISTIENDININIGYKGLIKTFTLKRLVGTTDYDLYVPTTYVSRSSDGKFGTESISVQITERQFGVNNSVTRLTTVPEGYTVYYLGGKEKGDTLTLSNKIETFLTNVDLTPFKLSTYYAAGYRAFEIWLQKETDIVDTVRIQIVSDGKDGAPGGPGPQGAPGPIIYPAGVYSDKTTYERTGNTVPYVVYKDKYYICMETSTGVTPGTNATYWSPMTQFDAVFTKLLVAENGTIGQAVYSGDYMFSQSGTNYDDDGTIIDNEGNCIEEIGTGTNYSKFWVYGNTPLFDQLFNEPKDRFVPSMLLDFKTGAGYFHHGDVRFDTKGVTIGSNVTIDADVKIGDFEVNKTNNFTYAKNGCWGYTLFDSEVTNINKLYAISQITSGKTLNLDAYTLLSTYDAVEGRLIAASGVEIKVFDSSNNNNVVIGTYTVDKFGCLNYIIYKEGKNIRFQALNQFKIVNTTGTPVNEITIHFNLKFDTGTTIKDSSLEYVRVNMYDETKHLVYTGQAQFGKHDYNGNSYYYIITLTSISSIKYIGVAASRNEDYSQGFFSEMTPFNSPVSGTATIDIVVESL